MTMVLKGKLDAIPEDVSGYTNGDLIIVGNQEYVFFDTMFVKYGAVASELYELEPCPFCGGEATTSHGSNAAGQFFFVSCEECGCRTRDFYKWFDSENYEIKAVEAWNTRKPIDEIVEQLEELRKPIPNDYGEDIGGYLDFDKAIKIVRGGGSDESQSR